MGEYRTPGGDPLTMWGLAALAMVVAGVALGMWRELLGSGIVWWEMALAVCAAYALKRAVAAWRRVPTVIRLSQSQISVRRGDGILVAEIPYAAIKAIRDRLLSDSVTVYGTDGISRIDIPLGTKGIRELLTALAEQIPPYLWDAEETRSFGVPLPWILMGVTGVAFLVMVSYFLASGGVWPAILGCAFPLLGFGAALWLPRAYQVSRGGITIRRILGARLIPAAEIASVQLKRGRADSSHLYVNLLLHSGKHVGLIMADQSAVVVYRTLLDMQQVRAQ